MKEKFNIPNVPSDPRFTGGIYRQAVNGYTAFGVQNSNPQYQNPDVLNPKVNFSKIVGQHSFKSGYEYQAINTEIDDFAPKYGTDNYAGRSARSRAPPPTTCNSWPISCSARAATTNSTTPAIVHYQQRMHFVYLQDDLKVTPKLTLNIGRSLRIRHPAVGTDNLLVELRPGDQHADPGEGGHPSTIARWSTRTATTGRRASASLTT